jgi:hypothetical protein
MKWEQRGCYSTSGRLFEVIVEVRELVTDGESIPASAKDIRPDHRGEIVRVIKHLAKTIHEEGQQ